MKRKIGLAVRCVVVAVVLVIGVVLWSVRDAGVSGPTQSPETPAYTFWDPDVSDQPDEAVTVEDWSLIDCTGLTTDLVQDVFVPGQYWFGEESFDCSFGPGGFGVFLENWVPENANTQHRGLVYPRSEAETYWGSSFVYQFPESMGWGGVLWTVEDKGQWTTPSSYSPSTPDHAERVSAILCADDQHCLFLDMETYMFRSLKANVNGVLDPIGSAVTLLESVWRTLSVERPDLVPMTVPAINPAPYVPLTSPPYPGATPGSSPSR